MRRSWPTAASSAVRIRFASAMGAACGRLLEQVLALERYRGLGGERADEALVLGQERTAAQGQHEVRRGTH